MESLEFTLRKIDETRNDVLEEIKYNELINEKHENTCNYLFMLNTCLF